MGMVDILGLPYRDHTIQANRQSQSPLSSQRPPQDVPCAVVQAAFQLHPWRN
jgi:hypothetical protein